MTDNKKTETVSQKLMGNKNAAKPVEEKATLQIQMRVTPERKNRYVLEAKRNGLKISEWIQNHMDTVCDEADAEREKRKK
ncbi:hypothetical protein UXN85_20690 [Enterobacter hormaechei]